MVEECLQREPEYSTQSTAPTVRTSEETEALSRDLSPRRAREGEDSKGGEPNGPIDSAWARALFSAEACKRGVCAYRNPDMWRSGWAAANGCDGYHASRSTDADGRETVRWGLCPRHREWWRRERLRQSAAKVARSPHPGLGPER